MYCIIIYCISALIFEIALLNSKGGKIIMKNYKKFLSFIMVLCITLTSFSIISFAETGNEYEKVRITQDGVYINSKYYTQEEFVYLLNNAEEVEEGGITTFSAIAAAAGTYVIAGIGKVVITKLGEVVIAGVVVGAGTWLFSTVKEWFEGRADAQYEKVVDSVPRRLRDGNVVDLDKFNKRVKVNGETAYEENGGWVIQKDRSNNSHGGSEWKLKSPKDQKDKKGKKRTATLDSTGKILRD